jgi:hypothetical protein
MPVIHRSIQESCHNLGREWNEGTSSVSCHFSQGSDGSLLGFEEGGTDVHNEISSLVFFVRIIKGIELSTLKE